MGDSRAVSPSRCGSLHARTTPKGTMYYLGFDVHKNDSYVAVLDDDGEDVEEIHIVMTEKRFAS